jgi:hypothetical protein
MKQLPDGSYPFADQRLPLGEMVMRRGADAALPLSVIALMNVSATIVFRPMMKSNMPRPPNSSCPIVSILQNGNR